MKKNQAWLPSINNQDGGGSTSKKPSGINKLNVLPPADYTVLQIYHLLQPCYLMLNQTLLNFRKKEDCRGFWPNYFA